MPKIVKNTTILNPLNLIAPHYCRGCGKLGEVLCECCKNDILNSNNYNMKRFSVYNVGIREGLLAKLIYDYKYNSVRAIGIKLAELLYEKLPSDRLSDVIIVPLPTSTKHIRERGFDHVLHLARGLASIDRRFKVRALLVREKNSVQVGANRQMRLAQAECAYNVKKNVRIDEDAVYLLLDDVWTTGASMLSATKKLRASGAKHILKAVIGVSELND